MKKLQKHSLEDFNMLLLNFSFVMIYIIRKTLVFLKNNLNYLKDNIFECFFKKYNKLKNLINFFFS